MNLEIEEIRNKYKEIAVEVRELVAKNERLFSDTNYYKGTQILYSDLRHKPKFMFIGINPGAGYFDAKGKNVEEFDEQDEFEYLDETYSLANETKELFRLAGCFDDLKTAVKTNCFFLATRNSTELDKLLGIILHKHNINLYDLSADWVRRIIEIVEPEIIICEGKNAFGRVTWNILDCKTDWKDGFAYVKSKQNIHIIGYQRFYSKIKNKDKVALKIKELVESDTK